jgi:phage-related protein
LPFQKKESIRYGMEIPNSSRKLHYQVIPLPRVQREAKKLLSIGQLREGIGLAKRLRSYPDVPELSIEPCGNGMELRVETPNINKQGWMRAAFWVHEKSRVIYIVDLFWKKTNQVTTADLHRINHRIRLLKAHLGKGINPWKSGE